MNILLQTVVSGVLMGSFYGLLASGLSLVWGVMGIINFAHADFMMLTMYLSFWLYTLLGWDPLISIPLGAIGGFALGFVVYRLLIKRVIKASLLTTLLATFGLALVLRSTALLFWGADYRVIRDPLLEGSLALGGVAVNIPRAVAGLIGLIVVIGLYLFIKRTQTGKAIQAISMDREAALVMGINADRLNSLTFAISGASAGIAGPLLATFFPTSPEAGVLLVIFAFTCVALGGFGSVLGAWVAGLMIGVVELLTSTFIGPQFKYAAVFVVYILVVLFRPKGLFGW